MEKGEESSGKGSIEAIGVDQSSVFAVNPSNYTGVSLINCKLNGSNYLTWSRAMMTALPAKNKVGMVDGLVPRLPNGDPNQTRWDMCNALVISWIFNTLDLELQSSVACERDTNISVKGRDGKMKQEGMSVPKYYSWLKTFWDDLDNYLEIPTCTCSAARMYAAQREREKTHQFLLGLGSEFNTMRSNIPSHEPAHSLNKVLAMIPHEERKNLVALSHENAAPDGSVFLSRVAGTKSELQGGNNQAYGGQGGSKGGASGTRTKTCYHCDCLGHIKSSCWLLHSYPAN
ncbi:hypothetical protein CRG98_030690 [Punica granatum]|uniref:Retrotransposon Copia-like N-terminal domain-containing protein n=1 Tax=Punica granatum TaxID=22663 RepID=A0A2I0IY57_PUNGR|nr:hypothetical protein CRG98_030690 [Punica granatum]